MKISELHSIFLTTNSVCTDTRKIQSNDLFFALRGDNFNGNTFAKTALQNGAAYVVIDDIQYKINERCLLVDNTLETLQALANYHRRYLNLTIIALTGSNGKTTTKELIYAVLKQQYNCVATIGNLNNHIGVPLTLLSLNSSTEIGIIEMGANHLKEIEFLCAIAEPNFGYITNFGKAHLEGFGGIEGVIKGKSELYTYLKENDGLIFINTDDSTQLQQLGNYSQRYTFGISETNNAKIEFEESNPFVRANDQGISIQSQLIGHYNFNNISAAIAIGHYFNVTTSAIKSAIESYVPENNRSQIIQRGRLKIILDAYNANPTSMKAALDNFSQLTDNPKTAILGDMFELGNDAELEHQQIAEYAKQLNINEILLVGENFFKVAIDTIIKFETFNDLKNSLALDLDINKPNTILIKGSRGMALERILDLL